MTSPAYSPPERKNLRLFAGSPCARRTPPAQLLLVPEVQFLLAQRIAQGIGQAADFADGLGLLALAVDVNEVGQFPVRSQIFAHCSAVSKLPPPPLGEDRDGARLADEEMLLQEPRALHALALGVELGEHVVGDRHVESVPGRDRQHEETADQDQPRMGNDHVGQPVPETSHQAPRQRPRQGRRPGIGLDRSLAADAERPEDRAAEGPQQGRGHGHAGQQGHDQRHGDRGTAGTVLAEVGKDHRPQPQDRRHGAGRQGVPRLPQGLFQRGPRLQAALEFLAVTGDQEQAIVGRRAEENDDDEDMGRRENLEVELLPADPAADRAQQVPGADRPIGPPGQ